LHPNSEAIPGIPGIDDSANKDDCKTLQNQDILIQPLYCVCHWSKFNNSSEYFDALCRKQNVLK
jgi:hypothetical protein